MAARMEALLPGYTGTVTPSTCFSMICRRGMDFVLFVCIKGMVRL